MLILKFKVLTGVSIVVDHLAVLGLHSYFAYGLESKPHPAAGWEVRQDESRALLFVPQVDFLGHVVCPVEVEGGNEEEGVLCVLRWSPDQRYGGAVPGLHLKRLRNIGI